MIESLGYYALGYGAALSIGMSALIFISLWHEPRMWLHDAPKALQDRVAPKSDREKMITRTYSALMLPMFFGLPIVACAHFAQSYPDVTFLQLAALAFAISTVFCLVDLIIIDWIVVCFFTPRFVVIPGTEGAPEYQDYWFHFRGFLIGIPLSMAVAIVSAGIVFTGRLLLG